MFKFIYNAITRWLNVEKPPRKIPMCNFDRIRYEVRPCDVLLIEGRSRVSDIIMSITQSSWSHSVLYLGRIHDIEDPKVRELARKHYDGPEDAQLIIEGMLGKGTVITSLSHYEKDHIRICRPRGLSPKDGQKVIQYAIGKLGTNYDVRQILDLARFLFLWPIFPKKWRSRLFNTHPGDTTKTVCSTMIAEAFASVEFPILPHLHIDDQKRLQLIHRNPKLFTPRDFDYSPYFEIIKYPFIAVDESPYRKLPWNREGLVSHDFEVDLKKKAHKEIIEYELNANTPNSDKSYELENDKNKVVNKNPSNKNTTKVTTDSIDNKSKVLEKSYEPKNRLGLKRFFKRKKHIKETSENNKSTNNNVNNKT